MNSSLMGGSSGRSMREFEVPTGGWVFFGASRECDIYVPSTQLPERAAKLHWIHASNTLSVQIVGSGAPQLRDGHGPHDAIEVAVGEWFEIGDVHCIVTTGRTILCAWGDDQRVHRSLPAGTDEAQVLRLTKSGHLLTLGSSDRCDLTVDCAGMPGAAAKVSWNRRANTISVLRDSRSDRGVFLTDGEGVHESVELQVGDWFTISGILFTWSGDGYLRVDDPAGRNPTCRPQASGGKVANHDSSAMSFRIEGLILPIGPKADPQKQLHVTFQAPHGRIVAVCGPSGCGKSTLLRALLAPPSRRMGQTVFLGAEPLTPRGRKPQHIVALVPQHAVLAPDVPIGRMLLDAYWLKRKPAGGKKEVWGTLQMALEYSGLTEEYGKRRHSYASNFSGGQQKRISLALEMMSVPDVLLLDEPNSGLDPGSDKKLMASLDKIAKSQSVKVVVVVTHSLANLPSDSWLVLIGMQSEYRREVVWSGPKSCMYQAANVAVGDDAALMDKLERGWAQ